MIQFPDEPKKIKARIARYERALRKEQKQYGHIDDGYGKRYLLGPLYMLLGDEKGAVRSFEWFEQTFPDDMGDPIQYLCWALALYHTGDTAKATRKLQETMLSNLYLIPHLLGEDQDELDIWHGTNIAEKGYLEYCPPEIWALWDDAALEWARETYDSDEFRRIRGRYIEILEQLGSEPRGPRRSRLVDEMYRLQAARPDEE
jgi:hypothetical protein